MVAGLLLPTHHTGPRVDGIVHRVQANEAAATEKVDLDDNQVVDVVEVLPNRVLGDLGIASPDNEVPGGTAGNLGGHMAGQDELTIIPSNLDLETGEGFGR